MSILEFNLMAGAFAVRRLQESGKLPREVLDVPIGGAWMSTKEHNPASFRFSPPLDILYASEMFDYRSAQKIEVDIKRFVNQLIHSNVMFYLAPEDATGGHTALLVASDFDKRKRLLAFWLYDVALLYERVALTVPSASQVTWSQSKGDFERVALDGELSDIFSAGDAETSDPILASFERIGSGELNCSLHRTMRRVGKEIAEIWP